MAETGKNQILLLLCAIPLTVAVVACALTPSPAPTQTPAERPTPPPTRSPADAALGDTRIRPADGMVMVYVPGGTFPMGSDESDPGADASEFPRHLVTLSGFWIDRTEVTNAQYERCVDAGACTPSGHAGVEEYAGGDHPVEAVSWHSAAAYCEWAGAQLPTEAEWEAAARGPEGLAYPWGDGPPTRDLCNCDSNEMGTAAADAYPAGASWCGALNMAGNVSEWVADWYDAGYYADSPAQDPTGPETGEHRVLRGGTWGSDAQGVRAASRSYHLPPDHLYGGVGFRCTSQGE